MVKKEFSGTVQKELDQVQQQFDQYKENIDSLTLDRMNQAPKAEVEQQTQLSTREISRSGDIYLKPFKVVGTRHKFNERFREEWNYRKQYVNFIAENREIKGEILEFWTYPYGGVPCEFWKVPVNKPVWAPRYVAEQIKECKYHTLIMQENKIISTDSMGILWCHGGRHDQPAL